MAHRWQALEGWEAGWLEGFFKVGQPSAAASSQRLELGNPERRTQNPEPLNLLKQKYAEK